MFRVCDFLKLSLLGLFCTAAAADELTREELNFFESKIRPVLIRECYGCHSNKSGNVRGGLKLDTRELMRIGGSTGPAVVPGKPDESWLYNAITHQDFVMPPKRKLPQNVIADFKKWIEMGAPDPRETTVAKIQSTISKEDISTARDSFWAYQPPERHTLPDVEQTGWAATDIDRFVLAKLEESDFSPAADAEPWQVLRRLTFDLVGLPPSPKQIKAFTEAWESNPDRAIETVVDKLLESPQFGERWGRHWLDVVRYAESTGRGVNMTYPHAWRYRDYVIDSFNEDKPFNRFVQEQLAGDLLPVRTDEEWSENLVATTFLAIGPRNVNENNRVQFAADLIDEQIDTTTRVFMGMSVACARCHDHKFDAIPQADYYAMAGIFRNATTFFGNPPSEYGEFTNVQAKRTSSLIRLPVSDPSPFDKSYTAAELADLRQQMTDAMQSRRELRNAGSRDSGSGDAARNAQRNRLRINNQLADISAKLAVVDQNGKPISYTMGVQELADPQNARILARGEIDQPGREVSRGFPQVLCSTPTKISSKSSGRKELARWIGSDENPLTARVMVNRIWQHMMGRGIVSSTENFGVTGQLPSHPRLLDNLAVEFVESGWSVKTIVKQIALSRVYRIQSSHNTEYHELDPDNTLLWRANARRLDAEAIRDAMLAMSGQLDLKRPRGSEVAKAGYVRVQGGVLGNPRDIAREAIQQIGRNSGGQIQPGNGRGQFGGGNRPQGGRPQFGGGNRPQDGRPQFGSGNRPQGGRPQGGRPQFGGGRPQFGGGRPQFGGGRPGGFRGGQTGGMDRESIMSEVAHRVSHQLDMEDAKFRSVYLPVVRDEEPRSLEVFDFADSSAVTGQRETSNTANQALYMMNNRFVIQQSEALADRLIRYSSVPAEQVGVAVQITLGRAPTAGERAALVRFAREFSSEGGSSSRHRDTLAAMCQSLFACADFRYVE